MTEKTEVAGPVTFGVAAFGDSIMWGQGVARGHRFADLIVQAFSARPGTTALVYDRSRSGAPIDVDDTRERDDFVDTWPELFTDRRATEAFLLGDEGIANDVFGEIPSTFPTISWQVRNIDESTARRVRLALIIGGGNDVDFEAVVNSQVHPGLFVEAYAGPIREVCYRRMRNLITSARERMPDALILVFGYPRVLSYRTNRDDLTAYAKHEKDDDFGWFLNQHIFECQDVQTGIAECLVRGVWAQALATYWLRRAIFDTNQDNDIRGPGVLFVPARFTPENAIFGRDSLIWDDYTHPTSDDMQQIRVGRDPRSPHLAALQNMSRRMLDNFNNRPTREQMRDLADTISGPTSLQIALRERRDQLGLSPVDLLGREINRIQRVYIASYFHPNRAGHATYAETAVTRYDEHRRLVDETQPLPAPDPAHGGPESFDERLRRFGLRSRARLAADIGHQFIDSVRVIVHTSKTSDKDLAPDLNLILSVQTSSLEQQIIYPLGFQKLYRSAQLPNGQHVYRLLRFYPQCEPGSTDDFSVDTGGRITLDNLTNVQLALSAMPNLILPDHGQNWRPSLVTLELNSVPVLTRRFDGIELGPGQTLSLGYPPPAPGPDTNAPFSVLALPGPDPEGVQISSIALEVGPPRQLSDAG